MCEPFLLQLGFIAAPRGEGCHLIGIPSSPYTLPGTGETDIVESIEFNQKIKQEGSGGDTVLKANILITSFPGADSPTSGWKRDESLAGISPAVRDD